MKREAVDEIMGIIKLQANAVLPSLGIGPVKLTDEERAAIESRKFAEHEIARVYSVDPKDVVK